MLARCILASFLIPMSLGSMACSSSRPAPQVVVVEKSARRGPPPHAPAHGYRHKHRDGTNLIFDAPRGVYVVVGRSGCYWHDDHYYRDRRGTWEVSVSLSGPWRMTKTTALPEGLRADNVKHGKGKKKH